MDRQVPRDGSSQAKVRRHRRRTFLPTGGAGVRCRREHRNEAGGRSSRPRRGRSETARSRDRYVGQTRAADAVSGRRRRPGGAGGHLERAGRAAGADDWHGRKPRHALDPQEPVGGRHPESPRDAGCRSVRLARPTRPGHAAIARPPLHRDVLRKAKRPPPPHRRRTLRYTRPGPRRHPRPLRCLNGSIARPVRRDVGDARGVGRPPARPHGSTSGIVPAPRSATTSVHGCRSEGSASRRAAAAG